MKNTKECKKEIGWVFRGVFSLLFTCLMKIIFNDLEVFVGFILFFGSWVVLNQLQLEDD